MSADKDPLSLKIEEDEELLDDEEIDGDDPPEAFSCKYCQYQTPDIDDLDDHIITHDEALLGENIEEEEEQETPTSSNNNNGNSKSNGVPLKEVKPYIGPVDLPIKRVKQQLPAFYEECANKPNKKVFVCPYCGYQSMKKFDMNRHLKDHNEPVELPVYACSECPYTTRRKCDMPKHLLTHCKNGTVPMYKCTECPYATKRKGDLSKHMLCHTKPSMSIYSCSNCPYSSKRSGDLKKHILSHEHDENGAKSTFLFNCTECGYTSKRLNDLHKHAVLHCDRAVKGVFKCPKCDYASAAGSPFAKHILSHCEIREMSISIFPKDSSMQEYIVLEEEELHLYQLDKDNIARVEVLDKDATAMKRAGKRKLPNDHQYLNPKKSNSSSYYAGAKNDLQQAGIQEVDNSKVVVVPEFNQDNEQNVDS